MRRCAIFAFFVFVITIGVWSNGDTHKVECFWPFKHSDVSLEKTKYVDIKIYQEYQLSDHSDTDKYYKGFRDALGMKPSRVVWTTGEIIF